VSLKYRKQMTSNSNSIYDYSYGKNTLKNNTTSIRFLTDDDKQGNESKTYVELPEVENVNDVNFVIEAQYETGKLSEYTTSASIVGKSEGEKPFDYLPFITTPQTDYIPVLTSSDPIPGAFDDNVIILVKEEHQQYNQEAAKEEDRGIYKLPDGRSYRAAVNKMTVSRLKKAKDERKDVETAIGDFYYVEYSRIYAETVITSDVIQPNVPITFLKNPIVINYREETHEFKLSASSKSIKPESITVEIEE
ncbi:MAG: hypothetical protein MJ208_04235, partial [Bacilli bacterium]|nr:hypothetical protein [Bacilli bacterium]